MTPHSGRALIATCVLIVASLAVLTPTAKRTDRFDVVFRAFKPAYAVNVARSQP